MSGISKGKWARRNEQEWGALLLRFERSGLGVEAFCRREAISVASFYRWRNLLSNGRVVGDPARHDLSPAFLDLGALNPISSHRPKLELKLDLGEGLVVHLVRH